MKSQNRDSRTDLAWYKNHSDRVNSLWITLARYDSGPEPPITTTPLRESRHLNRFVGRNLLLLLALGSVALAFGGCRSRTTATAAPRQLSPVVATSTLTAGLATPAQRFPALH